MPTLNYQDTSAGLAQHGPCVPVVLTVTDSHQRIPIQQGKPIPDAVNGIASIDTGASSTCVDQGAATKMGLPVTDRALMISASHAKHEVPVYSGKLVISGFVDIDVEYAVGANLDGQNPITLIGRDILKSGVLVYNGTVGTFSISV